MLTGGTVAIDFVELRRNLSASAFWGEPVGYAAWRFRPVVTNKTESEDVALFKRLLNAPVDA